MEEKRQDTARAGVCPACTQKTRKCLTALPPPPATVILASLFHQPVTIMKRTLPVLALAALLSACTTTAPVVEPPPQPQPKPQPKPQPEPPQPTEPANFADWQQAFAQRAAAAGIRHEDIQQLLARTHYEEKVVSADRKQP